MTGEKVNFNPDEHKEVEGGFINKEAKEGVEIVEEKAHEINNIQKILEKDLKEAQEKDIIKQKWLGTEGYYSGEKKEGRKYMLAKNPESLEAVYSDILKIDWDNNSQVVVEENIEYPIKRHIVAPSSNGEFKGVFALVDQEFNRVSNKWESHIFSVLISNKSKNYSSQEILDEHVSQNYNPEFAKQGKDVRAKIAGKFLKPEKNIGHKIKKDLAEIVSSQKEF